MSGIRVTPPIVLAAGAAVAAALGLTTYTLPNHAGPSYGEVSELLRRALGDPPPSMPGPAGLPFRLTPASDSILPSPTSVRQPALDGAAGAWLRAAIARDSAAVRGWLGPLVFATASVRGDTILATWWRPAWRSGCPIMSRLQATSTGRSQGETQVVRLTATCPSLPGLMP